MTCDWLKFTEVLLPPAGDKSKAPTLLMRRNAFKCPANIGCDGKLCDIKTTLLALQVVVIYMHMGTFGKQTCINVVYAEKNRIK